ncbi:MAG: hypothetical protein O7C75_09810 [Verrucomicrobia bacterium]|nr:hypothetical protein [Verrucomicrobiota bacterium]
MKSRVMLILFAVLITEPFAELQAQDFGGAIPVELRNQIRREKFDLILPQAMRKNNVDMWIHVMRDAIPDRFGREELGSESGLFVFTDRGGDRIERAVLGRRWGATQRQRGEVKANLLEESGAYDIIHDPVFVVEPVSDPMTEYDYRFKGLKEFVEERDPKRIAINFMEDLGPWPTTRNVLDGISYTDYRLLAKELGDTYTDRLVSSEYVLLDYISSPVPVEVAKWKRERSDQNERVMKAIAEVVPGVSKRTDIRYGTIFTRRSTGVSQRGRTKGYEQSVVQRGDIVAFPSQGMFAYVLREDETEPPSEIKRLYAEYLKIDKILIETIKAGLTPREIVKNYKKKFDEAGIIVVDPQMHMVQPKNNFSAYSSGYDPEKTLLSIDCHPLYTDFSPRVGSYGPDWTHDIPLAPNHHYVLEYFFYMPSPTPNKDEDQYLFFWDHEQAVATENGTEYLTTLKKELYLIAGK